MELKKKKIYMSRQEAEAATQITLDEDRNVPDQKPDMETIVLEKADVTLSDTRLREERQAKKDYLRFYNELCTQVSRQLCGLAPRRPAR